MLIVAGYNGNNEPNGTENASSPTSADPTTAALTAIADAAQGLRSAANEAGAAISNLSARIDRAENELETVKDAIDDLRGIRIELRAFSEQIGALNDAVMRNLRNDLDRERRLGEIQADLAREAARKGAVAGAKLSAIVTATVSLLWLAAWLWAAYNGNEALPRRPF